MATRTRKPTTKNSKPQVQPEQAEKQATQAPVEASAEDSVQAPAETPAETLAPTDASLDVAEATAPDADASETVTGNLAGVVEHNGKTVALADLPEAQLRQIGVDMQIVDAENLPLDQLVAEIQAQPAEVGAEPSKVDLAAIGASSAEPGADDDEHLYVVNRQRFRHDGHELTFGSTVIIRDARRAAELLALGAILETH